MPTSITLRISDIHGVTNELAWPGLTLTIGSHPSCGLPLSGRGIADHHCVLEVANGGVVVRDNGSHAGTFVNSERLDAPRLVAPGDRIYIGEYQLEFVAPTRAVAPPRAPVQPPIPAASSLRRRAQFALGGTAVALVAALAVWPSTPEPATVATAPFTSLVAAPLPAPRPTTPPPTPPPTRDRVTVHHEVIPGELLADIVARYNVSLHSLIEDNNLSRDRPPPPGTRLTLQAYDPPLPKLRFRHTIEPGDTWASLSERFEIDVELLHRYNPGELDQDSEFIVWVDPQIKRWRDEPVSLKFRIALDALSIGAPSAGSLERGLQLPDSNDYVRLVSQSQYGSSHTIQQLQTAIAAFRRHYRYPGVLVVSSLSLLKGGLFLPHVSHQSGRDVDIWLPALKGTYQRQHLDTDRKPRTEEINWYAAWGLVESLLATDQVRYIFLDRTLLPTLYKAAEEMGATPEFLAKIQWQPASAGPVLAQLAQRSAPVRHATAHTGHIHVRFRCGPDELQCSERLEIEEP